MASLSVVGRRAAYLRVGVVRAARGTVGRDARDDQRRALLAAVHRALLGGDPLEQANRRLVGSRHDA